MKYSTAQDINICIQILELAKEKTVGTYTHERIQGAVNRVILDLKEEWELVLKRDNKDGL